MAGLSAPAGSPTRSAGMGGWSDLGHPRAPGVAAADYVNNSQKITRNRKRQYDRPMVVPLNIITCVLHRHRVREI